MGVVAGEESTRSLDGKVWGLRASENFSRSCQPVDRRCFSISHFYLHAFKLWIRNFLQIGY